jgi:hypothetical protein
MRVIGDRSGQPEETEEAAAVKAQPVLVLAPDGARGVRVTDFTMPLASTYVFS